MNFEKSNTYGIPLLKQKSWKRSKFENLPNNYYKPSQKYNISPKNKEIEEENWEIEDFGNYKMSISRSKSNISS